MNLKKALNQERMLTIICRVEPGCLGPQGVNQVESFCEYAKNKAELPNLYFIRWEISPRYDMTQPEIEYKIGDKNLPYDKAAKYLNVFGKKIEEFEDGVNDAFVRLIEEYAAA